MRKAPRSQIAFYSVALLADAIAFLLTWMLHPLISPTVFALFYPAIMISSLYGGLGPGLFATALGGLATGYFFLSITNPGEVFRFILFLCVAVMISGLSSRYRATKQHAEKTALQLRESQDLFEGFMRNSPMTAFIKDEAGRYLYVNPLAERLFNRPLEGWLGKTDFELCPPDLAQQLRRNDLEVLTTGRVLEAMEIEPNADGDRYFMSLKFPVVNRSGETLLAGMSLDLTEYQRTENALRDSEARFRQMAETIQDVFWITDFQTPKIHYVSPAYEKIWGRSRDEIYEDYTKWIETIHPDDREHTQATAQACKTEDFVINEYRIVRPDGSIRWIRDRGYALRNEAGNIYRVIGIAQDITDYKLMLEVLRESEERFRALANSVPVWIWVNGADGRCEFVNKEYLEFLGKSLEDVMGFGWSTELHPDDQEPYVSAYMAALEKREPFRAQFRAKRIDGHYRWLESYALPRFNATGNFLGYVGSSFDITEIKEAEAALRLSENRYRTLANAVSQLMWVNDSKGNIEFFNQRWCEYTGKSDLQLGVGLWADIIHPDDFQHTHNVRTKAIAANEAYEVECRLQRFDHTYRWHLARIVPLKNERGQVLYWFGTATDIHNQKQIEHTQRLLAQASKTFAAASLDLQAVLNCTTQLVSELIGDLCILNLVSDDGQWLDAGSAHHRDDNARRVITELLQAYPRRVHEGFSRQVIQTGQSVLLPVVTPHELQIYIPPDYAPYIDRVGVHSLLVVPLALHEKTIGTLGICRDRPGNPYTTDDQNLLQDLADRAVIAIANAKLYAAEQRARADAEAANRIKDEFLAVLSHELRSPLNPILGWTRLLQTRTFDQQATQRALETIERNAKLQTQLIEDLLDISRILRGKTVLNVSTVNLVSIMQSAIETVRLAAEAKGIHIQTFVDPHLKPILGDTARLQQIVWNLLSNAIKFTPEGGRVEVRLESYEFSVLNDESENPATQNSKLKTQNSQTYTQITVTDTGKGISPDFLPYVFEYFRQEDGKTTRKFGGLGLGLAIVRYLTELHGGTVQAESLGDGKGATFIVRLPMSATIQVAEPPNDRTFSSGSQPPSPLTGVRVVVVDDEIDMRELMVAILERSGATVRLASSATEALALIDEFHPNILISDIGMPDIDGYMLVQQLRSRPPNQGGQIPAIALTAYAGEVNQRQALAAGFQVHLAKPIEPDELVQAIASLTGQQFS
jgi:PAS domain S-box-containing protein